MSSRPGSGRGMNPWNQRNASHSNRKNQTSPNEAEDRFRLARIKIEESVQKHLQQEYESSSDEEELESEPILKSVLKDYTVLNNSEEGLEKIHRILENSFQSGAGTCLICIATVKRIDAIWSCVKCYGFFHIICIQKWAKDSIFQQKQAQEDLPEFRKTNKFNWPCPKCRFEYEQNSIPEKYFCFCGKTEDPAYEPYLVPHSCGERCDKLLKPKCGHSCLLLCHPGPCPPCPKTAETLCHCKKQGPKVRRCSDKLWSCGATCGKLLMCKKHFCESLCHSDECPPCTKESVQDCMCGLEKRKQPCMTPEWQCEKVCGKPFSCGFHNCEVVCHKGGCGDCPGSLTRSCPCGKSVSQLPCTEEIPACRETCGKLLECGTHFCSQKCHKDKCGMCLEIVIKVCRCGRHKKELPCQREYLCATKCTLLKNCSRHSCNRKCCDKNCPPCEKQCGRTLSCGNHKCPSVCHPGRCYPCPEVVQIRCRCGRTVISVACGREKKTKPPRCSSVCKIPPNCHHPSRERHLCHFGECPPCEQICGKDRKSCEHKCPAVCHSAVWQKINENPCPAGPWEAAQIQYKRCNLPCPDCVVPVPVTCIGGHETREIPCYKAQPTSCSNPCGKLLKCGNHYCEKPCHEVTGGGDSIHAGENCSQCESECVKERPKGCTHQCPNPCHPGDCPPCTLSVKLKCHCAVTFLYIHCSNYFTASDVVREALLSCGNPCSKKYPCGHNCRSSCHSGDCPDAESCKKKVKISCKCKSVKKDVPCDVLRSGASKILPCIDSCFKKVDEQRKVKQLEMEKEKMEAERRNREEVEKFEKKFQGKRRHKENSANSQASKNSLKEEKSFLLKYWYIFAVFIAVIAAIVYFTTSVM